ncbi:hypothetical protein [Hymenobacter sp. BT190]|uniref:hypothetical protein n=1 Tax=Hymenobacter sp. BT190 TaxID=2763505 RepID=UPI00165178FD|nr:hypothetical protein [Hymenobacter sp. BT190]MBC6698898.1 hypothetical protein [Hymenobacter sp. BT190]
MSSNESIAAPYTLSQALAVVFGTPPFGTEYTTEHVGKVLGKLLGYSVAEAELLAELRAAPYATPKPGRGKYLLKWRFTRAEPALTPAPARASRSQSPRKYAPQRERPISASMKLKR